MMKAQFWYSGAFSCALWLASAVTAAAADTDTRAVLKMTFPAVVETELALSGAPEYLRAGAAVYVFGPTGYTQARAGTNGFTCLLNRDGFLYGGAAFKPTCWDSEGADTYVPVMLKTGEMLAAGKTAEEVKNYIAAGFRSGRFHPSLRTGVAYMLAGDVELDSKGKITKTAFPGHYMIYAPGVTNANIGYVQGKSDSSMPFIFSAGAGGPDLAYMIVAPHHAK